MSDQGRSDSDPVSRSETADRDVQWMIGKEEFAATCDHAERKSGATGFKSFALTTKIGGKIVFSG
jgi:hypothetical protein